MVLSASLKAIVQPISRWVVTQRLKGDKRLHLGCGGRILKGWANIDRYHADNVVAWDLAKGLPVKDDSVDYIYSEHFIEHLPRDATLTLLRECRRVLSPGGVFRVSTPDLKRLISDYHDQKLEVWSDVDWYPQTPCQLLNEGMRSWGHEFVYDQPELESMLVEAGFTRTRRMSHGSSDYTDLQFLESRPDHEDLILEAYFD